MPHPSTAYLRINSDRLCDDFEQVSAIGLTADRGICRTALSLEDLEARAWFANRIEEAGFLVHDDDAGNLSGVLRAANPQARTLLIGSHLDTVPNAGRYDGALGIVTALECMRTIHEAGIRLAHHLEVIDFTDDEGTWMPMFGSMSLSGRLDPAFMKSADGQVGLFRAALAQAGIRPEDVLRARRDPATVLGYIELHIEQGWRLERAQIDVGVVTGIVARMSYSATFHGQASHAGTASMRERRDALQGAARFIVRAHDLVREHYPEGTLNCGVLDMPSSTLTTVPDQARVLMEWRHSSPALLYEMERALLALAQECAAAANVTVEMRQLAHIPAAQMSPTIIDAIERACKVVGVTHTRMASYASHNSQVMSAFTPSGMLFIPSLNGLSHNPDEFSRWDDVVKGANVLLHAVLALAADG